jgi:5-methylcytosine-specific restriction enzyme subunit McrC
MTLLRVLEHQWIPIGSGPGAIPIGKAAELERLAQRLPIRMLEWRRQSVKFTQYCGVLQLGETTIEVLPKIHGQTDPGFSERVLVRLLQVNGMVEPVGVGEAMLGQQAHTLLDVFIDHFRGMVQQQLQQGLIRRYVTREDDLPMVKGRLDLNIQLRRNALTPHRASCRYDEFDADNIYNRTLRYVVRQLVPMTRHPDIRRGLSELLLHLGFASDQVVSAERVDSLPFDRTNQRWQPVFRRCADFLRSLHPNVTAGGAHALALMFDMNKVFEGYVTWRFRQSFRGCQIRVQGPRFFLAKNQARQDVFQMRPDIAVMQDGKVRLIADAKWKVLSPEERRLGISQSDMYQLAAYARRYACDRMMLVYPAMDTIPAGLRDSFRLQETGVRIDVVALDLAEVFNPVDKSLKNICGQ